MFLSYIATAALCLPRSVYLVYNCMKMCSLFFHCPCGSQFTLFLYFLVIHYLLTIKEVQMNGFHPVYFGHGCS